MATDEEYLDNLLKSITENGTQTQTGGIPTENNRFSEDNVLPEGDILSEDRVLPEDMVLPDISTLSDEKLSFGDDILSEGTVSLDSEQSALSSDDEEWMKDLQNLIGNDAMQEDNSEFDTSVNSMDDMDIADLLDGIGDMDDELEEISGLLKHADGGESGDVDMLAMLEGIDNSSESEEIADPFAGLLDESLMNETPQEEKMEEQPIGEEEAPKKKSKRTKKDKSEKKRWLFGKKKRKGQVDEEGEIPTELVVPFEVADAVIEKEKSAEENKLEEANAQDLMGEGLGNILDEELSGSEQESVASQGADSTETAIEDSPSDNETETAETKEKKPGFFTRLFRALTQEEEETENISEENKEILNELEEEDKENSKKKEKKGKKGGKKKKGKKEEAEGEGEESAEKNKKGKKPKKEKKPKEKEPKEKEPSVKVLGKKNLLVLIAFCATLVGSIMLLSFFLPEYADKKAARDAYYSGDYEEVYTLLYDRNLNSGDLLIYNRSKTIRKIERRIESYENNLTLGRDLEALDSLLKGVECYQTLTQADEFGVRREVDALYQQICGILDANYGITVEEAVEINAYDRVAYTKRLYEAVYGTSFAGDEEAAGGEAQAEESAPEESSDPLEPMDILPEEEGIING